MACQRIRNRVRNPDHKVQPRYCRDRAQPEPLSPRELRFRLSGQCPQAIWGADNSCYDGHKPENTAAVPANGTTFIKFENATLLADVSTTTTSPGAICGSSVLPALMSSTLNRAALRS